MDSRADPDIATAITALVAAIQAAQPPAPSAPQTMLTVPEAAEILRCGKTHIYAQIKTGTLRGVKLGRRRLIPMSEIRRITEGGQ